MAVKHTIRDNKGGAKEAKVNDRLWDVEDIVG